MFARFIRDQTYSIFCSCIFSFPYILISEIGISFSITDLAGSKFRLYRFSIFRYIVSMEISITLKTHSNKLQFFSKHLCNCHIDQIKERLVNLPLKMLGIVQKKKLYQTTLANLKTDIFCALQEASRMFNELSPKTFLYLARFIAI